MEDTKNTGSRKISEMAEDTSQAKRRLLSGLGAGGGVLGISALVPASWVKPVVNAVMLPAHAVHSPGHMEPSEPPGPTDPPDPTDPPAATMRGPVTDLVLVYDAASRELRATWTASPGADDDLRWYFLRYRTAPSFTGGAAPEFVARTETDDESSGHQALSTGGIYYVQVTSHYPGANSGDPDVTFTAQAQTAAF